MYKGLMIVSLLFFTSGSFSQDKPPSIPWASSFYKTTSGAIGPNGVIATTVYDLKINASRTIILDSALISGLNIMGDGIIIPTNEEGTIEFRIIVTTHQKDTVWYNGELEFESIRVAIRVSSVLKNITHDDYPAIVLYLRTSTSSHIVVKQEFDQEHSQYNK